MAEKVILIADPGIDTAFAVALALHDPKLEVLGLVASAGNIPYDRATQNVHVLINALDPPKWPRLGAALPVEYDIDGTKLHGADGLGNLELPPVTLHQPTTGDKLLVELVRANPNQVSIVLLGPATMLAAAFDRDPELPRLIDRIAFVGGTWHVPGNVSPVAEFHFYCDAMSARRVLNCGRPISLIPLDVSRKLVLSPSDLLDLPSPDSATCTFLRRIVPFGIRASCNLYGIEGFHLKDVLGVVAISHPGLFSFERRHVDVEVAGTLTRGMSVVDARPDPAKPPNVNLAVGIDVASIQDYIRQTLTSAN